jgi:hypothetical protein
MHKSLESTIKSIVSEEKIPNFSPGGSDPAAQNAAQSKDGDFNSLSGMGSDDIQTPATEYQRMMEPTDQVTVYNGSLGYVNIDPNDIRLDYSRLEAQNAISRNITIINFLSKQYQIDSPQIENLKNQNVILQAIANGEEPYQRTDGIEQVPDNLRPTPQDPKFDTPDMVDTDGDGVIDTFASVARRFARGEESPETVKFMGAS